MVCRIVALGKKTHQKCCQLRLMRLLLRVKNLLEMLLIVISQVIAPGKKLAGHVADSG